METQTMIDRLREALHDERLDARLRPVVGAVMVLNDASDEDIARALGVTPSCVADARARAIALGYVEQEVADEAS